MAKSKCREKSKIANGLKNIYIVRDYQKYRTKSDHSRKNLIGIDKNELRKFFIYKYIEKFLNKESNLHLSKYLISNKYDYILISYKYKDTNIIEYPKNFIRN